MSPEIIVEPAGLTPRLQTLIENLDLSPEHKKTLLDAQIRSIRISAQPALLIVRLDAAQLLPADGLEQLRARLGEMLETKGGTQMVWDVYYPEGAVTPAQYLEAHWHDLLGILSRQVQMARAYLSLIQVSNGEPNRLRLALPNAMTLSALQRQSGDKILSQLLTERLSRAVSVRFEIGHFEEELKRREALYQKRLREELERIQNESADAPAAGTAACEGGPASAPAPLRVLLGRKIASPPRPIASLTEEEDQVVLEGELITFECKTLRTGRQLALMDVYDKTGTLNARLFVDAGKTLSPEIKVGAYVRMRGTLQFDKFSRDLCLLVRDVSLGAKPERRDCAAEKRIELHAHSHMSAMDALVGVTQLVARAAAFGHAAVALTDHGVVQGFPEAMAAGEKHKIKVIYGMEGYLVEDEWLGIKPPQKPPRPYHICLLVAEPRGIRNLYHLVSEAHLGHFYYHPRIPRSLLEKYREGLLLGSACEQGELFRRLREGAAEEELETIARRYDYLEIMPRENNRFLIREGLVAGEDKLLAMNQRIYELGKRLGLPVAATGDVHFLEPGDEVFRSILHAGMGYADADLQAPLYFKTTEEMLGEFAYLGPDGAYDAVVDAPRKIAERIGDIQPVKKKFHPPKLPRAEEELKSTALARAREVYGGSLPEEVEKRLRREITAITKNHFASLFMIARRLVQKSLADGYLVGSRGSVGSSLTATMLGITEVNPLPGHYLCTACRHHAFPGDGRIGPDLPDKSCPACGQVMEKEGFDIPFEVFMGFEGDKLPDIDLNFSGEYQAKAHKALEEIFDRAHIFRAGTISTVADRIAYGFVKKYLEDNKLVVREAEVNRLTRGCAGVKKTTGQHPGGIMIVPQDMEIYDFTPVQRPADDRSSEIVTTHLDYHAIHDALLKLDLLGHDDPTSLKRLGDLTGVDVRSIPLDDPETLAIFSGVSSLGLAAEAIGTPIGTLGIPEFGTEFVRQMLEATRPKLFSELVRISGLSHGTDVWLNNAADLIREKTATLSTVISARDDIMNYLITRGMDPAQAFKIMESVRKGKGLSSEQEQSMRDAAVPSWYIDSCKKIKYIFPKAHAVAYCLMAFRIAYFKVHHPTAFYANYFTLNAEFFDAQLVARSGAQKVAERIQELRGLQDATAKDKHTLTVLEVAREAFARGLRFKPVSLMESDPAKFLIVAEGVLLPPLVSLSGLGATCAQRIVEERSKTSFRSIEDLSRRTGANKNVVEILIQHGCLGILPKTDQTTLF